MHDIIPPEARATAAGLLTMLGFIGAGITTVALPAVAVHSGLAAGFATVAALYLAAVALLLIALPLVKQAIAQQQE